MSLRFDVNDDDDGVDHLCMNGRSGLIVKIRSLIKDTSYSNLTTKVNWVTDRGLILSKVIYTTRVDTVKT